MMPEVDGWAVLEQLKAHLDERISGVKVLMMTALGADTDRLRGGIEGAVRYLVKPVAPDDLRQAVRDVLAGGPEREQRRQAQTGALLELARIEKGGDERVTEVSVPVPGCRASSTAVPAPATATMTASAASATSSPTSSGSCCGRSPWPRRSAPPQPGSA